MRPRPKYTYARANGLWAVYRMDYFANASSGTKVSQHRTREEANAEVYRLNGWNFKKANQK